MDKAETAAIIAVMYGLLEAVKLLAKALIDKKKGAAPQPAYKHDFMEQLKEAFAELTDSLRSMQADVQQIKSVTSTVDPATNWPRVWSDTPQQKRTHDSVGNMAAILQENSAMITEIHKKVGA